MVPRNRFLLHDGHSPVTCARLPIPPAWIPLQLLDLTVLRGKWSGSFLNCSTSTVQCPLHRSKFDAERCRTNNIRLLVVLGDVACLCGPPVLPRLPRSFQDAPPHPLYGTRTIRSTYQYGTL
eukprot:GGOE01029124.1.p5 GENE.GGOE01029124.1~~GGOE01029124.1.p5  ORF type:complete len:122 (-),score=4.30 GGOE01029124.1:220-585(-)